MVELKPMTKADIDQCGTIHYEAFYSRFQNALLEREPQAEQDFRNSFDFIYYFSKYIEDNDKHAYCICHDREVIGYIAALELPTFGGDSIIYIDSIAVSPKHQKHGYGRDALKQFMELFPASAVKRLLTDKKRPAFKMYESLGFIDMEMVVMEHSQLLTKMNNYLQAHKDGSE